jgi:hypothetical protein
MALDKAAAPNGRSTWLVLALLALFALLWWFLPKPKPSDTQSPLINEQPLIPPSTEQTQTPTQVLPNTPAIAIASTPTTTATKILGPSKGSLMINPKPRDLMPNERLHAQLNKLDKHMTAHSIAEAEWMDLQGFPTIEETNSIDADTLEKYHHAPNVNLRALALQAAIWKRQRNPAWRGAANFAAGLGSIFANRLLIDELMAEKFSLNRDKSLIRLVQVGKLLGDSYHPSDIVADRALRWETYKTMSNFEATLEVFQVYIPYYRAKHGLPPLQVVRRPGRFSLEAPN